MLLQYPADKLGLLDSAPRRSRAHTSQWLALNIYFELYHSCLRRPIPVLKQAADPTSEFMTKALSNFIKVHKAWLNKNGNNGLYFGQELTYSDLKLLNRVQVPGTRGVSFSESRSINKLE
ncbi:hypothetical protein EDD11_002081 [Mortierella claussenii]|nr:hypothetical protein EDD11_002081 [Mortierella claussenii]